MAQTNARVPRVDAETTESFSTKQALNLKLSKILPPFNGE